MYDQWKINFNNFVFVKEYFEPEDQNIDIPIEPLWNNQMNHHKILNSIAYFKLFNDANPSSDVIAIIEKQSSIP